MLEAQDILLIVLAFCALWITAFVCWLIWQVAIVIKNVNDVLGELKHQLGNIELALNGIKSKFDKGTGHLSTMAESVKNAFASKKKK